MSEPKCSGFDVTITVHTDKALKAMNSTETVRFAIGEALDDLRLDEEIDYTLKITRAYR